MQPVEDFSCERTYVVKGQGSVLLLDLQPVEKCSAYEITDLIANRGCFWPLESAAIEAIFPVE